MTKIEIVGDLKAILIVLGVLQLEPTFAKLMRLVHRQLFAKMAFARALVKTHVARIAYAAWRIGRLNVLASLGLNRVQEDAFDNLEIVPMMQSVMEACVFEINAK